ncbi:hypothetical protein HDF23_001371 [Mucilaginibacter lappiensis]|uniref:N-acetyltransferase domain-containing protein n=1 Tax=Mucilaginibacter lappiensis TaxID=354630 RepID=A0ABR6PG48_9SPHI|nr:GNAT family N-acetyltransferase [Mucilaginibacter lappiensis]MBB6108636.1 hypothetical protein [Mucilaginibacter lappiensis]
MSKGKISFREACLKDMPALSALAKKAFWETFTGQMSEDHLQAYIAISFSQEKLILEWGEAVNTFLIAFLDQELAGYAKISTRRKSDRPENGKYIEIERLYLLKHHQGKKIGTALMNCCIQYALDHHFDLLWLNVWEHNTEAMKFYQDRDFKIVDWSILMRGDTPQKGIWMKKAL